MLYSTDIDKQQNCPQCGDTLEIHFKYSKIIKCSSCSSSIFLEDNQVTLIGESSALSPVPSLLQLHNAFNYHHKTYMPLGKIRYAYGRGFWEEWFLKDETNKEYWLSVDEGDFVLEEKIELSLPIKASKDFILGKTYSQYLVTQKGEGRCVGFEGELPKTIQVGEVHEYVHLSQGGGKLVTVEFTQKSMKTFKGQWIDPLEIKIHKR